MRVSLGGFGITEGRGRFLGYVCVLGGGEGRRGGGGGGGGKIRSSITEYGNMTLKDYNCKNPFMKSHPAMNILGT